MHHYLFAVLIFVPIAMLVFAWAIFQTGRQRIVEHFIRYSRSYLVGAIFVAVSLMGAYVGEFEHIPKADRIAFDAFDWSIHFAGVIVAAGTTILAFLNQTNSADRAKSDDQVKTPPVPETNPPVSPKQPSGPTALV